jgi:hypothetical protein
METPGTWQHCNFVLFKNKYSPSSNPKTKNKYKSIENFLEEKTDKLIEN